jgi:Lar family restriction alleviation protein
MPVDNPSLRLATIQSPVALAACPFCASTNVDFYEHVYAQQFAVMCNLCGAEGPQRTSHEEAGRLWNRRTHV